tara:strand:- start:7119 stop:14210 length:7092 start_codon:yes stop_codon:yes gene_type:complete
MPQNTNLNVSPYFDDYDSSKNYNKVLFKPGTPVQARELTTLQSIMQGQIEKFGKHIFKEGSIVIPGKFNYDFNYTYVKIESTFFGVPVEGYYQNLLRLRIKGKTSGVTAKVVKVLSQSESIDSCTTLYIKYEGSSDDNTRDTFLDGENLVTMSTFTYGVTTIEEGSDFATCLTSNASGTGSSFTIVRGVFFARGSFVEVKTETLILDQYSNTPSYRVGFNVLEEIVTAVDDSTLYDNAAGFSNFTAPGSDRLKITLSLTKKLTTDFNDENFIELLRTEEGETKELVERTVYGEIAKEFARRTYDESGNYYVNKFDLQPKECLNDRYSNFGQFTKNQITEDGNTPSKDLMCIRIGPGKAFVKGYETSVAGNRFIDVEKPRTLKKVKSRAIPFQAGNKIRVNNVLSAAQVKINTTDTIELRNARLESTKSNAVGDVIGRARVYDYRLQNSAYTGDATVFELYLFDIITDTKLIVNQAITQGNPARVEGQRSGASGMLKSAVSNSTTIVLCETAGQFLQDEPLIINGIRQGIIITSVTEYNLSDIKSVRSTAASRTFTADVVLEEKFNFGAIGFSISAQSGGTSTLSSGGAGWAKNLRLDDIIQYTQSGVSLPVYHRVTAISATGLSATLDDVADVSDVCDGTLPSAAITLSGLKIVSGKIRDSQNGFLSADMPHDYIESVDLTESTLYVREEIVNLSTDGNGQMDLPSLTGSELVYAGFDEERYTVIYNDGSIEPLTVDQFVLTNGNKGATISGLTASQSSNVDVHVTKQKSKVTSKSKILSKSQTILVTGSEDLNDAGIDNGLTSSDVYGKRVQDREISLDDPDIVNVHAVFESTGTGAPSIPEITMASFTGPSGDNSDIIVGEIGIGKSSGASAYVLARSGADKVEICVKNTKSFISTEEILFETSGVKANVSVVTPGDPNIRPDFILDNGQRDEYYDFGRIVRKQYASKPQGQLKIYFDMYTINSEDSGDLVTASSYEAAEYDTVPSIGNVRNTDIIDLRPRVATHSGSRSPFEFDSRNFSGTGQSASVLSSDENITFDYSTYLGRKDRMYLNPNSSFSIISGTPSENPILPDPVSEGFELATIDYKPYVYDANRDVVITFKANRRYTMKDIGGLENRIENLEEVTTLTMLEAKTSGLIIKDGSTGLDRFKNGFVVDPFTDFSIADKTQEIKFEVDNGKLTAKKYRDAIDLLMGSNSVVGLTGAPDPTVDPRFAADLGSPNITKTGNVVTLKYNEVQDRIQPFATRLESINPYMYRDWNGRLQLDPTDDVYVDRRQVTTVEGQGFANDFVSETEPVPFMREQNIEFDVTVLKPDTKHYAYWSGTDMTDIETNVIPKLLEVTPVSGSFEIGETVRGLAVSTQNVSQGEDVRFRLCSPNHKVGPFSSPTLVYTVNPYTPTVGLSSSYSETSSVLNVDIASLNQKSDGNFFGFVTVGMLLIGESSGAQATISEIKLVSDDIGTLQGCYYIPPNTFQDGTNTATIVETKLENRIPGKNISFAETEFFSEGFEITETTIIRTEPNLPIPIINNITNVTNNITNTTNVTQINHVTVEEDDPLAQSFEVVEDTGIFMTGVDFYFQAKSEVIPAKCHIVTLENGFPSQKIMKNSEVELAPAQVSVSDDGSIPTRFQFPAPVFLPKGDYAFYLGSASGDYDCWISQVGENDISTANLSQFQQIVVSKQPTQGSLFKAQSDVTWTASQLEDLKYISHKAQFINDSGTVRLYNPQLTKYNERNKLGQNPIETFSKRVYIGLGSATSTPHINEGTVLSQSNNTTARGVVAEKLSAISLASGSVTITNAGSGYENGNSQEVNFQTITGRGSGAIGIVNVSSNSVTAVSIKGAAAADDTTGQGYKVGDTLTANIGTKGLGKDLVVTVGLTTDANALVVTNASGADFNTTDNITYIPSAGAGVGVASEQTGIAPSVVTVNSDEYDGTHFKVTHANHGHHDFASVVTLDNITGDSVPSKLTVGYAASVTSNVSVASSTGFNFFEGEQVSASNPGFAIIGDEVIQYTSVGTNLLSGTVLRGVDGSLAQDHSADDPIQKYELSGISLRKINKQHDLSQVTNSIVDQITLDSYHVKITGTKLFSKDKSGGGTRALGTSNITFDTINPSIKHSIPIGTKVTGKVRTITSKSVSGNESAYLDQGYEDISMFGKTAFNSPRMIATREVEQAKGTILALPGAKSFTFEATLSSNSENVSPSINVFTSSILTESARINKPISNFKTDRRSNTSDDPHDMVYLTKEIGLENPSTSIKVIFGANRPPNSDIRVLYRLKRDDTSEFDKKFELMPGFKNTDAAGFVINQKDNDGSSDRKIAASLDNEFVDYEYTADNLPPFTSFQIKVVFMSSDQADSPEIIDFRSIAVA